MELTVKIVEEILREYFKLNNYSKNTEQTTIYYLKYFDRYVRNELNMTDYREIREDNYYEYIDYLKVRGKKFNALYHNVLLKRIFRILEEEEKILFDPFCKIPALKAKQKIRDKILSESEMEELLKIPDTKKVFGLRNRAILEVLYGTGIRGSELCSLELNDYIVEEKLLFVRNGKGRKDRIVPIGDNASFYLDEYIKKSRKKLLQGRRVKNLFICKKGIKLNTWELRAILKRICGKMKEKKEISPHVIRHTYATHLLRHGAGIREIQLLLGHGSISTTQIYINLNQDQLKEEYEKYHPLENELFFDVSGREEKTINGRLDLGINHLRKKQLT
jgi:integrase/recombinase XerD